MLKVGRVRWIRVAGWNGVQSKRCDQMKKILKKSKKAGSSHLWWWVKMGKWECRKRADFVVVGGIVWGGV